MNVYSPKAAKELVVTLATREFLLGPSILDPVSPDGDEGKFVLYGELARAIHHFSGWNLPINLEWFDGSIDRPKINGSPFHWYAFAIPRKRWYHSDHYFICDYLQIREWVLDFAAPLGRDHRDHHFWRADLRLYPDELPEQTGYFRWGDEPIDTDDRPSRVFELDNLFTVDQPVPAGLHVGTFGRGGESSAHRLLKLYVAAHPIEFGLSTAARSFVEYSFVTGDRVDVLFENHLPDRTVIEVEVAGENNVCIGIHQAVKYRSEPSRVSCTPSLLGRMARCHTDTTTRPG